MKLRFLGGAETVTGSKFLIETNNSRVLVDCGLFQGIKKLRQQNWRDLPIDPSSVDAVILTHAHLDHSGYIPRLVNQGFRGKVYCTPPTKALCRILLEDSGRIQEEDAEYANRKGFSKHTPALPLYTERDAKVSLNFLHAAEFNEPVAIGDFTFHYSCAGHILGAASVRIEAEGKSVLFSGDLGRPNDPIMPAPAKVEPADFVVMESTYGDQLHNHDEPLEILADAINSVHKRNGVLLIPSFAVGRAQQILFYISRLIGSQRVPAIPVYMNSPMAQDVTSLYSQFHQYHKLSHPEFESICSDVRFVNSAEESKRLNLKTGPMVIVSASGMLTGGRVLHHLKAFGPNSNNTILLVGYQPPGTRGWSLLRGEGRVKIHGQYVPINAEIISNDSFSAHADRQELLGWLGSMGEKKPQTVFLVHGEPSASDSLRKTINEQLHYYNIHIPSLSEEVEL